VHNDSKPARGHTEEKRNICNGYVSKDLKDKIKYKEAQARVEKKGY
jgi:hypothetical protein